MGKQESKFDLHEMQMYFETEIRNVHTLSDLELNENDFRRLGIRLKSLIAFANHSNFADDFMLCVAIYAAYQFIYWDERYTRFNRELFQMFEGQSQYTQRHQLLMFLECFHDFGLNSYQIHTGNLLHDCEQLAARHAGIPMEERGMVFDLVGRYLCVDCDTALHSIQPFLPRKTRHIMTCLDKPVRLTLIDELQMLLRRLEMPNVTLEGMIKAFPDISLSLISYSWYWHENLSMNAESV